MKYFLFIILTACVLTLSSCATMINSRTTGVTILTSEPARLSIDKDTSGNLTKTRSLAFERDNKSHMVTAFNDSLSKTIIIKPRNSFAYWLNAYPNIHLWTGFYIDTRTKKRYTYPYTVYIDFAIKDSSYLTYKPLDKIYSKYSNIFKITPLKIIGYINPSIELSYERKTNRSFSTQIMASYLLPFSLMDNGSDFNPEIKGFRAAIEERFYLKKLSPIGPYLAFEFNYLKNKYKDVRNFELKRNYPDTTDNFNYYTDTFGIKKQTFSFNFKLGYQKIVNRISFDFYVGLGLKYRDARHFDRINPDDKMATPRHPNLYYYANLEGKSWNISIPMNVKVGWTF